MVPAFAGYSTLFSGRCAKYKTFDLFRFGSLGEQADYKYYEQAEYKHPSAEEQPVNIIEEVLEYVACITAGNYIGIAVVYFAQDGLYLSQDPR